MMTGWMMMSVFTVLPALLVAFLGSLTMALYGDIRRTRGYAPARWARLVSYIYRHRMVQ